MLRMEYCSVKQETKYRNSNESLGVTNETMTRYNIKKNIGVKFVLLLGRYCEEENRWCFRIAYDRR